MFADFRNFRQLYLAFEPQGMRTAKTLGKEQLQEAIAADDFTFLGISGEVKEESQP
jgi:hypothetical protein